ncbi:MAG: hypothetical protein HC913_21295 [Microscillaceae bacterium]|nr:hypothetical protein [Microscillaceae bacterium]
MKTLLRKRFFCLWVYSLGFSPAWSQNTTAWIDFNQTYFKIKITQEGLYQIKAPTLSQAGLGGIDPRTLQLFRKGQEQAIRVVGEEDGSLDANDFLEFYAYANEGSEDAFLYRGGAGVQPNPYYNLYSDTAAYFLTYKLDGSFGLRMEEVNVPVVTNFAPFHWHEVLQVFSDEFAMGQNYPPGSNNEIFLSEFDRGEGWTSTRILQGQGRNFIYNVPNLYDGGLVSPSPTLAIRLVGAKMGVSSYTAEIWVGPNTSVLRRIKTLNGGFMNQVSFDSGLAAEPDLADSDFSPTGNLVIHIRATVADVRVAFIRLLVPQTYAANGASAYFGVASSQPNPNAFVEIAGPPANASLYDLADMNAPRRIGSQLVSGRLRATIPDANQGVSANEARYRRLYLHDGSIREITSLSPVSWFPIALNTFDYLMISHPSLRQAAGGFPDIVQAYADYRASPEGGGYAPLLLNIQQVYDQFNYGDRSPLAIRRFAEYMFCSASNKPQHLFLVGRGVSLPERYYQPTLSNFLDIRKNSAHAALDLVPTAGFPASDLTFTMGICNNGTPTPFIPVGRLPAKSPQEILHYLNKIKEHEAAPPELWSKNLLHLSGGRTEFEQATFRNYLSNLADIAEGDFLGGRVSATGKTTTSPIETINVSEQINQGVGVVTFFGHSGLGSTDVEIGNVSNPAQGYDNAGRYTFMLTNGCQLGSVFYNLPTLADDWIFTPNKGAIGFIAHSYLGFSGPLFNYSRELYRTSFASLNRIGNPVGQQIKDYITSNITNYNNTSAVTTAQQMILLGDPAVQFFRGRRPDYTLSPEQLFLESQDGQAISAFSLSFKLQVIVSNVGRTEGTPFRIRVRRTIPTAR